MSDTTNAEMIALARSKCKLIMPVLIPGDVIHLEIVKADLIYTLKDLDPKAKCYWYVARKHPNNLYQIDIQD